ncbi:prophage tail fiber N-terminal domain-containing protein [Escherichia coli]|nr:prophage tail fiber N-terminal domain-containing protein [Escherichia coli]
MAVRISGVLKDGAGKPIQNCTIQLKARRNSTTVVVNTVASENPDEAGRYTMDVEYGQYSVSLLVEGFPPSHAGIITVYEDSKPGTLNDFLGAMTEDDARPEALRRFELMVEEVARNASAVEQNTAAAKKSASDAGTSAREAATHATDAAGSARAASTSAGQAATSAQSASSSAGTASTKATEASKSAAAAESSKSAAATSAGAAKTSETNAAASEQSAATSASTATTKASEAATSARDASASKEAAKSSETNASSSASSAASSATAAGNSAKAAKTSETNAKSSETAAGQSASAAAGSKTAAVSSASAASTSAGQASASATAAGKSAESAASSASTATTKAGEATEQASAAARSASAAKTSETNAKASETSAESSKTAAASSASSAASSASSASASKDEATRQASAAKGCATTASTKATEAAGSATAAAQSKSTAESAATRAETAAKRAEDIASAVALEDASTTKKGVVQLSSATNSTSETLAATPKAVKAAYDNAEKRLQKDQNGADIPDKDRFLSNINVYSKGEVDQKKGMRKYTFSAPANAVSGKWYPIVFRRSGGSTDELASRVVITTYSSAGGYAMNNCEFNGFVMPGGWFDRSSYAAGFFSIYSTAERAIHSIISSVRDDDLCSVFYVEARAFPINIFAEEGLNVIVPTADYAVGQTTYKWGATDPLSESTNAQIILDFKNGRGYYCSHPFISSLSGNAATATKLQTACTINGVSFDGTKDITLTPKDLDAYSKSEVQSALAGKQPLDNTLTNLSGKDVAGLLAYLGLRELGTSGEKIPLLSTANTWSARQTFNGGITGALTGNADTATKLKTARNINGVRFDGSGDININTLVSRGRVTALEANAQGTSGIQLYEAYNNGYPSPYGNVLHLKGATAAGEGELFIGWSGTSGAHAPVHIRSRRDTDSANWSEWAQVYTSKDSIPGVNAKGDQDTSGNAATATKLQTACTINGVSFDGSKNIELTAEDLNLQEFINKANNAVQRSGDILSGGLTFENDSILAWIRNTDWAKIGFKNDADSDTDSYMWFETGDNGNEYFKWRSRRSTTTKDLMTLKWDALNILVNAVINGSLGVGTTNALGGSSIVLGDNDTGFKQNGDGFLDVYANSQRVFRFQNGVAIAFKNIQAGDSKKFSLSSSNTSTKNATFNLWGASTRPVVAELGDEAGWHFYSQRNTDNSVIFSVNGQIQPSNWGNFDSRYVKDVRLGTRVVQLMARGGRYEKAGHAITGLRIIGEVDGDDEAIFRPIQKYINGTWYNVAQV